MNPITKPFYCIKRSSTCPNNRSEYSRVAGGDVEEFRAHRAKYHDFQMRINTFIFRLELSDTYEFVR